MRASICPGTLRLQLANISLVQIEEDGGEPRFRLAGSGLRDILGIEARGRHLSDVPDLPREPWVDGIGYVLASGKPAGGTIRQENNWHSWLRLPLHNDNGQLRIVMCHDELIDPTHVKRDRGVIHGSIHHGSTRLAA